MDKGFTLLELIVVIIILGILASLGFTQYTKMVEKGRTAEARVILGQMRTVQMAYCLETGAYGGLSETPLGVPFACTSTHFFTYSTNAATGASGATRCSAGGKTPNVEAGNVYSLTLDMNGVFSGTPGYY